MSDSATGARARAPALTQQCNSVVQEYLSSVDFWTNTLRLYPKMVPLWLMAALLAKRVGLNIAA